MHRPALWSTFNRNIHEIIKLLQWSMPWSSMPTQRRKPRTECMGTHRGPNIRHMRVLSLNHRKLSSWQITAVHTTSTCVEELQLGWRKQWHRPNELVELGDWHLGQPLWSNYTPQVYRLESYSGIHVGHAEGSVTGVAIYATMESSSCTNIVTSCCKSGMASTAKPGKRHCKLRPTVNIARP